jgi:hypothetical protein
VILVDVTMYMYEYGHRRQNREKRRRIATQDPPLPAGLPCIATHSRSRRGHGRPHPGRTLATAGHAPLRLAGCTLAMVSPGQLHLAAPWLNLGNGRPHTSHAGHAPTAPSRTLAAPWQQPDAH